MDDTFNRYRSIDSSFEDDDTVEESFDISKRKKSSVSRVVVMDSDADGSDDDDSTDESNGDIEDNGSDDENAEHNKSHKKANISRNKSIDESMVQRPKKSNRVFKIDSDSEDDTSGRTVENEPTYLSSATRFSIHGVKPTNGGSDESDFIKSDDDEEKADSSSSSVSLSELLPNPYIGIGLSSTRKNDEGVTDSNDVNAPFDVCDLTMSPAKNMNMSFTNEANATPKRDTMNMSVEITTPKTNNAICVISSEDDTQDVVMVTPKPKSKSFQDGRRSTQPKISNFMKDNTYPNSQVVYVTKQTRQLELNKLNEMRLDLSKIKTLLSTMNLKTLPDHGVKLTERLRVLEITTKQQAEKVSNMVIESDLYSVEPKIKSDLISWEQLQEGSQAVKPKMLGTKALNTHMVQQTLTLDRLKALHSSLDTRPTDETHADPPNGLVTSLMPHQLHALAWLSWRESQTPHGGILADDMGLGKTLTMISLMLYAKEKNVDDNFDQDENDQDWVGKQTAKLTPGGTLVICPASLISQWQNEITTHCKKYALRSEIHHGNKRETKTFHLARNDVVITTYNIIQRDLEKNGVLMRIRWRRVILDEAHIVRNHKSRTAQAVFKLTAHSRWCLTGTPVHNKDIDLFSLLKFLRCSPFDDIVLWKKWIDNKSTGGQERLAAVMKSLMLRRTKQQLQQQNSLKSLPQKTLHYVDVTLSKNEMNVYEKVLAFSKTLFAQFLHQRAEKHNYVYGDNDFKSSAKQKEYYEIHRKMVAKKGIQEVKSHEILVLLLRLRQICCHPGLIHAMLGDEDDANQNGNEDSHMTGMLDDLSRLNIEKDLEDEIGESTNSSADSGTLKTIKEVLHISNPVFDLKLESGKVKAVLECLKNTVLTCKGDKAIIVSQWTSMLDIIGDNLKLAHVKYAMLTGKVPVPARQDIIQKFNDANSNVQVLLLSLCAGGVGLNLIGANHLMLTDLHWNPQLEAQAQDRIYRVGQKKDVHIYKFVCLGTIEQTIKQMQDKKLELAENILTGAKMTHSSKLSIDDLKLLFSMK